MQNALRSFSEAGLNIALDFGISGMKYVYLLESLSNAGKRYVGITSDLAKRLQDHNNGKSPYTAGFKPWKISVAIRFSDDAKAAAFEKYLKSGSGMHSQNVIYGKVQ